MFDPEPGRLRAWLAAIAHPPLSGPLLRRAVRDRYATRTATEREPVPRPTPRRPPPPPPWPSGSGSRSRTPPAPQRTAVLLPYYQGRTFRQVARLTGVREGTAKSRLRLGLRRIADRLQSEGLDGEW